MNFRTFKFELFNKFIFLIFFFIFVSISYVLNKFFRREKLNIKNFSVFLGLIYKV